MSVAGAAKAKALPLPLDAPRLYVDLDRVQANIAAMLARARSAGVRLRPHFKTHQSHAIGRLFREQGVSAITVSSLAMAEYFAADGWADITIAFPFHPGMAARTARLARAVRLGILLSDPAALDGLEPGILGAVDAWIEVDVGAGRSGARPEQLERIAATLDAAARHPGLRTRGFLCHAGHSYGARGPAEIQTLHREQLAKLERLARDWRARLPALELSLGDTPSCATQTDFAPATELRPGNFVFFDLSQWQIGACTAEQIAVALACPVVARQPERGELVLHAGAVHLSREGMRLGERTVFGLAADARTCGWGALRPERALVGLSQEHGRLAAPADFVAAATPGDLVWILPVHSCLAADVSAALYTLDGDCLPLMPKGGGSRV